MYVDVAFLYAFVPAKHNPMQARHAHAFTVALTISQLPLHLSAVMVAYAKVISNLTHDLVQLSPKRIPFFGLSATPPKQL